MEMHELKQAWSGLDERLEQQVLQLRQLQRRHGLDAVRARLRLVSMGQYVQLAIGILIVFWAGGYWFGHLDQPHLVVYGVSIHLYGLGLLIDAGTQLTRLAQLDYRKPVFEMQGQLVALRRLRVRSERALMLGGFVVWVPFLFVAARAAGLDVWLTRPDVVWWNLAVALALVLIVAALMRRYRAGFERDAVGRSLREAEAELVELSQAPPSS